LFYTVGADAMQLQLHGPKCEVKVRGTIMSARSADSSQEQ